MIVVNVATPERELEKLQAGLMKGKNSNEDHSGCKIQYPQSMENP